LREISYIFFSKHKINITHRHDATDLFDLESSFSIFPTDRILIGHDVYAAKIHDLSEDEILHIWYRAYKFLWEETYHDITKSRKSLLMKYLRRVYRLAVLRGKAFEYQWILDEYRKLRELYHLVEDTEERAERSRMDTRVREIFDHINDDLGTGDEQKERLIKEEMRKTFIQSKAASEWQGPQRSKGLFAGEKYWQAFAPSILTRRAFCNAGTI